MDDDEEYDDPDDLDDLFEFLEALEHNPSAFDQVFVKSRLDTIIKGLEAFLDGSGLRGAPDFVINELIKVMRKEKPYLAEGISTLASLLDTEGINALSKEAWIFLFGKA